MANLVPYSGDVGAMRSRSSEQQPNGGRHSGSTGPASQLNPARMYVQQPWFLIFFLSGTASAAMIYTNYRYRSNGEIIW